MAINRYSNHHWLWLSTPKFTATTDLLVYKDEFGEWDFKGAIVLNPAPILSKFNGDEITILLRWVNKKWPGEVKAKIFRKA
jgi:hypothetical protein